MHRERIGELGGRASGDGANSNAGASGIVWVIEPGWGDSVASAG